ncbi:hypothetical protein G6689_01670 [Polynucleobacter paneuropaeus]|nr:hypothetical protein G6716_01660 [Polynucleobacter paneuropaeus]QWD20102.1 hypothetical protein G6689_01670 [Polynucleobacter paneuropaeus]
MSIEIVEHQSKRYAEIIWAGARVEHTKFFSPSKSSMQFGLLAHQAGFIEAPHLHHHVDRVINDLQQMFVVQRGIVAVDFYSDDGILFREVILKQGDAILLVDGIHAIRVLEDMQCISVKQGPFFGDQLDKINVDTK